MSMVNLVNIFYNFDIWPGILSWTFWVLWPNIKQMVPNQTVPHTTPIPLLPPLYITISMIRIPLFTLMRIRQCGGSGMFIPDPGSWFLPIPDPGSRIPDPKTATKERGEIFCHTFLCSHKFPKIENFFSFEVLKKKIWSNFQRIIELFTQKICH